MFKGAEKETGVLVHDFEQDLNYKINLRSSSQ